MNVGALGGMIGSAAGAPLSQTAGSETERSQRDSSTQQRQVATDKSAEQAAGIGTTDEDQGASERDADGRRFWETPPPADADAEEQPDQPPRHAKDPSGLCGGSLDLTG